MLRALLLVALCFPVAAGANTRCAPTFSDFLNSFEADVDFQRTHTRYPLIYSFVDENAEPEPKEIIKKLSRANAVSHKGIVFPEKSLQKSVPLERQVRRLPKGAYAVRFDKPDSDVYSVEFVFEDNGRCWRLISVADMSL